MRDLTQRLSFHGMQDAVDTEAVVQAKCDQAVAEIRDMVNTRVRELREEVKAMYAAEIRDFQENMDLYLAHDARKLRFIHNRHLARLRAELNAEVEAMLARTHLVG